MPRKRISKQNVGVAHDTKNEYEGTFVRIFFDINKEPCNEVNAHYSRKFYLKTSKKSKYKQVYLLDDNEDKIRKRDLSDLLEDRRDQGIKKTSIQQRRADEVRSFWHNKRNTPKIPNRD